VVVVFGKAGCYSAKYYSHFRIIQGPVRTNTYDAIPLVKGLYVGFRILTRDDGNINLIR
jgi:hypothetical protein